LLRAPNVLHAYKALQRLQPGRPEVDALNDHARQAQEHLVDLQAKYVAELEKKLQALQAQHLTERTYAAEFERLKTLNAPQHFAEGKYAEQLKKLKAFKVHRRTLDKTVLERVRDKVKSPRVSACLLM
jgi:hypothetical protein